MRDIQVEIEELRIDAKVDEAGIQYYQVYIWSETLCEDINITDKLSLVDQDQVQSEILKFLENENQETDYMIEKGA